jgi:hypothetical protein
VALPPGSLKSPTYRVVREPLKRIEREMQERFDEQRDQIMEEMQDGWTTTTWRRRQRQDQARDEAAGARLHMFVRTPRRKPWNGSRPCGGVVSMLDSRQCLGHIAGRYNKGVANLNSCSPPTTATSTPSTGLVRIALHRTHLHDRRTHHAAGSAVRAARPEDQDG